MTTGPAWLSSRSCDGPESTVLGASRRGRPATTSAMLRERSVSVSAAGSSTRRAVPRARRSRGSRRASRRRRRGETSVIGFARWSAEVRSDRSRAARRPRRRSPRSTPGPCRRRVRHRGAHAQAPRDDRDGVVAWRRAGGCASRRRAHGSIRCGACRRRELCVAGERREGEHRIAHSDDGIAGTGAAARAEGALLDDALGVARQLRSAEDPTVPHSSSTTYASTRSSPMLPRGPPPTEGGAAASDRRHRRRSHRSCSPLLRTDCTDAARVDGHLVPHRAGRCGASRASVFRRPVERIRVGRPASAGGR